MTNRYEKWAAATQEMRRARLRQLIDERFGGCTEDAAKAIGRSGSQVGSLLKARRGFGEDLARNIEARLKLPFGWLDSRLILDTTTAPEAVTARVTALTEALISGRISLEAWAAAMDGALAIASASPPALPPLLPRP